MSVLAEIIFWTAWGLIFYAYIGFPIALGALAFFRGRNSRELTVDGRQSTPEEEFPKVAMVVAAFNEEATLSRKLLNTWAIDYPRDRLTLVVGSDGSTDGGPRILQECEDPRLQSHIFPERRGKISVLNDLMKAVDADIVIMSDANTLYHADAVRKLVAPFADPRVGCVSGELTIEDGGGVSGEGLYWRYEGWIKRCESKLGFLIGCNGGIFAIRPEAYTPLPANTIVEDFVLTMSVLRQGWRIRFDPEARAAEPPCPSTRAEMVRKIRIGAGGFQALTLTYPLLSIRYGLISFAFWGHKVLRWFVPLFLIAALIANTVLLAETFYAALFAAQMLGVLIATTFQVTPGGRSAPKWLRPISYFYLMNYALLCGFLRFIFRTQRVTWDRVSR